MWLWPKSGGEETVIHPGTLINYHTDCLLIFLCSLWYLMKYTHFMQNSHRMADADGSKADANAKVGQVSTSAEGQGQGQIHSSTALNLSIKRLISSPTHKGWIFQSWSPSEANQPLLIKVVKLPRSSLSHFSFLRASFIGQQAEFPDNLSNRRFSNYRINYCHRINSRGMSGWR